MFQEAQTGTRKRSGQRTIRREDKEAWVRRVTRNTCAPGERDLTVRDGRVEESEVPIKFTTKGLKRGGGKVETRRGPV